MKKLLFPGLLILTASFSFAQQKDSVNARKDSIATAIRPNSLPDSVKKKHTPRGAAIRSAILPGWGQVYNNKIWKVPIVYAALGITGGVFNYNLKNYRKIRFAYITIRDTVIADYPKIAPELQPFIGPRDIASLQRYRDEFRKNIDYSVLFFILFWGLNVVDATVDAHLRDFDVGNNLSLRVKPNFQTLPNTVGVSFVFTIGKNHSNRISSLR